MDPSTVVLRSTININVFKQLDAFNYEPYTHNKFLLRLDNHQLSTEEEV